MTEAMIQSARLLADPTIWAGVSHTEANATSIFKLSLRVQALLFDQVLLRVGCYPLKLIDLLQENSHDVEMAVAELRSAPSCMLDKFSAKLREENEDLKSPLLRMQLHFLFQQLSGTIYGTERLHASNNRRRHARSMTKNLKIHDLAAFQAGRGVPAWAVDVFGPAKDKRESGNKRKMPPKEDTRERPRKRRGGGGSMRAFFHVQAQQLQVRGSRFNFKAMHEAYRNLSAEQKAYYRELGVASSSLHRDGMQSFPPTFWSTQQQAVPTEQTREVPSLAEGRLWAPLCACVCVCVLVTAPGTLWEKARASYANAKSSRDNIFLKMRTYVIPVS